MIFESFITQFIFIMQAIFTQEEIAYLDTRKWWVACNITPYIIKMGVFKGAILLCISNLRNLWVTRVDKPNLLKQKQIYAKTMQVSGFSELIALFEQILSNPQTKAIYHFYRKSDELLAFKIQKQIQVYPFEWKFQLISIPVDISEILCKDILNPSVRTLQAQQKRFQIMKKKIQILQQALTKKMTQAQKKVYKSVLVEDQQDLKLLVQQPKQQQYICDLRMDTVSTKLFRRALQFTATKVKNLPERSSRENKVQKVQGKVAIYTEPKGQQLINQLQMKKQEQKVRKKKKALDFL